MKLTYSNTTKERLDKFLHRHHPSLSRTQIQKFIRDNVILVNGKKAEIHHWLKFGDLIELPQKPVNTIRIQKTREHAEPSVLYQDADFAIILKPAGMLIHETEHKEMDTLVQWLIGQFPSITKVGDDVKRPGIVHRLDKDIAGLVLISLNSESFMYYKQLFHDHQITKRYRCLIHGTMAQNDGVIDTAIERNKKKGLMVAQSGRLSGKAAVTTFEVVQRFTNYTLLDVQIITGRTHQIRTHLYSIGHSIAGDPIYQTRDLKKRKPGASLLDRPFLFAYHLSFIDRHGQKQEFTIELPQELKKVLASLK